MPDPVRLLARVVLMVVLLITPSLVTAQSAEDEVGVEPFTGEEADEGEGEAEEYAEEGEEYAEDDQEHRGRRADRTQNRHAQRATRSCKASP